MKLKEGVPVEKLLDFGFEEIDKEYQESIDDFIMPYFDYSYNLGHSRRGQFYYLLVNKKTRVFDLYASEPDGSGSTVEVGKIFKELIEADIAEW